MLHVQLNQSDGVPMYLQLLGQIKHMIATGRLGPDDELPPVRVLAQQLVVNPSTVVRAYRELEVAGLVYKRRGAGTFVASRGTPYAEDECRRMLLQRTDALMVEARHLGFTVEQVKALVEESGQRLAEQEGKDGQHE